MERPKSCQESCYWHRSNVTNEHLIENQYRNLVENAKDFIFELDKLEKLDSLDNFHHYILYLAIFFCEGLSMAFTPA